MRFDCFFTDRWPDILAARQHLGAVFHTVHSSTWQMLKTFPLNRFVSMQCSSPMRPCEHGPFVHKSPEVRSHIVCSWLNTGWHLYLCGFLNVLSLYSMGLSSKSNHDTSEHVFWRPVPSFRTAASTLCQSSLGWMCRGTPFVKGNYVLAAKPSCGSVSLRRYQFSWWKMC